MKACFHCCEEEADMRYCRSVWSRWWRFFLAIQLQRRKSEYGFLISKSGRASSFSALWENWKCLFGQWTDSKLSDSWYGIYCHHAQKWSASRTLHSAFFRNRKMPVSGDCSRSRYLASWRSFVVGMLVLLALLKQFRSFCYEKIWDIRHSLWACACLGGTYSVCCRRGRKPVITQKSCWMNLIFQISMTVWKDVLRKNDLPGCCGDACVRWFEKAGSSLQAFFSISFSMNCRHTGNFWYIWSRFWSRCLQFSGAFGERQASRDCVLYSLYAAYRTLSERVSIGSIRDGGFVKLPAGIYEGALSDVFLAVTAASEAWHPCFLWSGTISDLLAEEAVILNFLVPLVNVYMMIQVMGIFTGEEFCRSLLSFWKNWRAGR